MFKTMADGRQSLVVEVDRKLAESLARLAGYAVIPDLAPHVNLAAFPLGSVESRAAARASVDSARLAARRPVVFREGGAYFAVGCHDLADQNEVDRALRQLEAILGDEAQQSSTVRRRPAIEMKGLR